jgi:hypothetical protein
MIWISGSVFKLDVCRKPPEGSNQYSYLPAVTGGKLGYERLVVVTLFPTVPLGRFAGSTNGDITSRNNTWVDNRIRAWNRLGQAGAAGGAVFTNTEWFYVSGDRFLGNAIEISSIAVGGAYGFGGALA